jgi:hypothetical protein
MQCKSRITKESTKQLFGDTIHYFYLEMRCTGKSIGGYEVCASCIEKNQSCVTQASKKFDHGLINEPITEKSHIYGSPWYLAKLETYGNPTPDTEEFAMQYQNEARGDYIINIENRTYKAEEHKKNSMTRGKKEAPVKDGDTQPHVEQQDKEAIKTKKPRKKPQTAIIEEKEEIVLIAATDSPKKKPVKKSSPKSTVTTRKRPQIAPEPVPTIEQEHKDSCIATHIENDIEELDLGDCDIVYVDLVEFEHDNIKYYHEPRKGKLYKKLKDKSIGQYVGRFNSEKSSIDTTIPDSDDEGED